MSGNLFPHTVRLLRKTTTNVSGGGEATYTTAYGNFAALIAPANSSVRLLYAHRDIDVTHTVFTAKQITANMGDVISYQNRNLVVHGIMNVLESNRLTQLDCYEIATGQLIVESE